MQFLNHFLAYSIPLSIGAGAFFYGIINMVDSIHIIIHQSRVEEFTFSFESDYNLVIASIGLVAIVWGLTYKKYFHTKSSEENK